MAAPYVIGRSLKAVAQRAGKSQNWLSARLHGRSAISADDIYLLARGLQCDPCDFYRSEVNAAPIPSREDREPPADIEAERLIRRLIQSNAAHEREKAEKLAEYAAFLEWQEQQANGQ